MQEVEYLATVRGYLMAVANGYDKPPTEVVLAAKGVIYRGEDPVRLTFQLDEYANGLGLMPVIQDIRSRIAQMWIEMD